MIIQIDPEVDTFLLDHVVDGSPLLPTVMQLDLVARRLLAQAAGPGADRPDGILLRDIRVGRPARFSHPGPRPLYLRYRLDPAARHYELRSPGYGAPHLVAAAEPAAGPAPWVTAPAGWAENLRCGPDLVYPPFFHGPVFQVVGAFGRAGTGLAAVLAPGLAPLSWGHRPTVLQPRLLELLLQCCGLHELARTGRMMVPAGLAAVRWYPGSLAREAGTRAVAMVLARPGRAGQDQVFDGDVVTPGGTVLLTVTGYRATDLGLAADRAHAARLTRCLDHHHASVPPARAVTRI